MKIDISVELTPDRILARMSDSTVVFDEPAVVGLKPDNKGRQEITGIGRDILDRENSQMVPLVSELDFRPALIAAVSRFVVHKGWRDVRPGWRILLMTFDHVDVRISIETLGRLPRDARAELVRWLYYDRHITWWINGEKVKY